MAGEEEEVSGLEVAMGLKTVPDLREGEWREGGRVGGREGGREGIWRKGGRDEGGTYGRREKER